MTQEEMKKIMETPRLYFDTRVGITMMKQEKPETWIQEVSQLRRLFVELHKGEKLSEFVLDGEYLLERHGKTLRIEGYIPNKETCKLHGALIVDDFLELTKIGSYKTIPASF